MTQATVAQIAALFKVLRADADASGYGFAISNTKLQAMAQEGATAVMAAYVLPSPKGT